MILYMDNIEQDIIDSLLGCQLNNNFDNEKINYNINTFEYYAKRFKYHESIPGLTEYIYEIVETNKNKSPLDEILERKKINND